MISSRIHKGIQTKFILISFFLFVCLIFFPSFLLAQDSDKVEFESEVTEDQAESQGEVEEEEDSSTVSSMHSFVSTNVLGVAERADTFFGDNRSITDSNRTRIRLRLDLDFEQDEGTDLSPNVLANISLPGTQDRLKLFINGDE